MARPHRMRDHDLMSDAASPQRPRFAGRLPEALLVLGAGAILLNWALVVDSGFRSDPLWAGADVVALTSAAIVRWKRPDLPASFWLIVMFVSGGSLTQTILDRLLDGDASATAIAWANLASLGTAAVGAAASVSAIGLYPEGRAATALQRWITRAAWFLVLPPLVVTFATPQISLDYYVDAPVLDNPLHVLPFSLPSDAGAGAMSGLVGMVTAAVMLIARYRRSDPTARRRMRVLLVPIVLVVIAALSGLVLQERVDILTWGLLVVALYSLGPALAIGIVQPRWFNADAVLRPMLVYGALWLMLAVAFVTLATLVGVAAGAYLPVRWSIAVALVAAMLFQPVRTRLERLADRWVFGDRTDPARVIEHLGDTLATTFELGSLLERMVAALKEGLAITWANVRLSGMDVNREPDAEPDHSVPIVFDGEEIGVVECGPKAKGTWTDADRRVVATFAGQAALAVRNVRLTENLRAYVAEIAASRARLVRAQETERRRIERNIHDGVQQELVGLIGLAGQMRAAPPTNIAEDLAALQSGLTHVLEDLRELAKGIHPTLLSDQGLLTAVEELAARHPIPVEIRADPALRGVSFAAEAEGALYFAAAEALANSLKHANARQVEVTMTRQNGSLTISVRDDGRGFAGSGELKNGSGLAGLRDRISALDGTLKVLSELGRGTTVVAEVAVGGDRA